MGRTRCGDARGSRWGFEPGPPPPDDEAARRHQEIDSAIVDSRWRDRRRADRRRTVVESAVLLGLVTLLVAGLRPIPLAIAFLLAGPAAGLAIDATQAGRAGAAVWGALGFLLLVVPATFQLAAVGFVLGCPLAAIAFAAYGVRRESRAHPGWE